MDQQFLYILNKVEFVAASLIFFKLLSCRVLSSRIDITLAWTSSIWTNWETVN